MEKTDTIRFTETEKDILTDCNVFITSDEDTFYRYLKTVDRKIWKPHFKERENGNHLYVLERIKPMTTATNPHPKGPSEMAVKAIIFCLCAVALAFIISYLKT